MRSSENARTRSAAAHGRSRLHALPDHIAHDEAELPSWSRIHRPVAADRDSNGAGKVASGELHALDPGSEAWRRFAGGFRRSTAGTRKRSRDQVPGRPVPRAFRRIAAPQRTVTILPEDMARRPFARRPATTGRTGKTRARRARCPRNPGTASRTSSSDP